VSVISGYDLIEWLMERLNIDESGENILVCFRITYLFYCVFILIDLRVLIAFRNFLISTQLVKLIKRNKLIQTTFFHSNTSQIYYINLNFPRMYTTCFGLYLGHLQACQPKNIYIGRYSTIDGLIIACCVSQSTLIIKVFKQATFRKQVGRNILHC
jgi:hypothetical protein